MSDPQTELEIALRGIAGPLQFASKNNFEKLDRVKGLQQTLEQALLRIIAAAQSSSVANSARGLLQWVPSDSGTRRERIESLTNLKRGLDDLALEPVESTQKPKAPPLVAKVEPASIAKPAARPSANRPPGGQRLELDHPLQFFKGVGPKVAQRFGVRSIVTIRDLLLFLPRRYEDRRASASLAQLEDGVHATVEGEVLTKSFRALRGKRTLDIAIGDGKGTLVLKWFRVPSKAVADRYARKMWLRVSGKVSRYRGKFQMVHPEVVVLEGRSALEELDDAIVPVYLDVDGIPPNQVRSLIGRALPAVTEFEDAVPKYLLEKRNLVCMAESIAALHLPPKGTQVQQLVDRGTVWHRRLIYEELLLLQLVVLRRRLQGDLLDGLVIKAGVSLCDKASEMFGFDLTSAQARVLEDIQGDLEGTRPMHRLLQGDVGSGKTAVAMAAALGVALGGYQTAVMAPTELLAEQHARVALKTLTPLGIKVGLLTGMLSTAERRRVLQEVESGEIQVVVGTHALIQQGVVFKSLALGIVDEQHRFGVMQRARFIEQGREATGKVPHILVMTATPIPRTLALTVYGDLDLSVIDELPPGRTPIETVLFREKQREQVYARVRAAIDEGRQAYVVLPLVEESDKEGMANIRDATSTAEELAGTWLYGLQVGLLHGRMTSDEKDSVMRSFSEGRTKVLVSTTVIEVGIDVPNATVMVIEHAERFGLSQLHQLRGRVGRGAHKSSCLLVSHFTPSEDAWRRLTIMEQTTDGFRIAEEDLEIRGPGDFVGTRQSGLPVLSLANLARDQEILLDARTDAGDILERDLELSSLEHAGLRKVLNDNWSERLELAQIG